MRAWLKSQFADQDRARRAVLSVAMLFGTVGFCVMMGALLFGR